MYCGSLGITTLITTRFLSDMYFQSWTKMGMKEKGQCHIVCWLNMKVRKSSCLENDLKENWDVKVACMRGGGFTEYHDMHGNGNDSFLLAVISISGENTICLYPNKLNSRLGKPWGAIKMTELLCFKVLNKFPFPMFTERVQTGIWHTSMASYLIGNLIIPALYVSYWKPVFKSINLEGTLKNLVTSLILSSILLLTFSGFVSLCWL